MQNYRITCLVLQNMTSCQLNRGGKLLERLFLNLIERIVKVQHSHINSSEKDPLLSRNWEFIFSDFDGWQVLYCSTRKMPGGYWVYPMLLPNDNVGDLKKNYQKLIYTSCLQHMAML